jgi:hypothetical protein
VQISIRREFKLHDIENHRPGHEGKTERFNDGKRYMKKYVMAIPLENENHFFEGTVSSRNK